MQYHTLEEIYTIFKTIRKISTDSRHVINGSLFFALRGERFDGNDFVMEALEKGASYAITDKPGLPDDSRLIRVEDTLATLQQLAILHRNSLNIPVIAIAGSNGKTTTKELIAAVLSTKYQVAVTRGNLNNHIGVPLTILSIEEKDKLAVVEIGANHQGEHQLLCQISQPTHGIVTNIGKDHLQGFGGTEGVLKAYSEIYHYMLDHSCLAFVNADDPLLMRLSTGIPRVTYGSGPEADFKGKLLSPVPVLKVSIQFPDQSLEISTQLVGAYNFSNVMAAACIGNYFGVEANLIRKAIEEYRPENYRSQLIITTRNTVIMDAYNANPSSMEAAIKNFMGFPGKGKVLILGDMLELGEAAQEEHLRILHLAQQAEAETIMLVGQHFAQAASDHQVKIFPSAKDLSAFLKENPLTGKTILIKGSRGIALETILEYL